MAGYIIKQPSGKHSGGKLAISSEMTTDLDSELSETCEWVELVDRGGLKKVTDETFFVIELIEKETRSALNQHTSSAPQTK